MLHKWLAQVISRRAREMSRGLSQILPIAVIVVGFVSTTSESTLAGDRQISVAGLIERLNRRSPQKIPFTRFLASKSCSKDCGMSSGSTSCNDNQSCDCACNRSAFRKMVCRRFAREPAVPLDTILKRTAHAIRWQSRRRKDSLHSIARRSLHARSRC